MSPSRVFLAVLGLALFASVVAMLVLERVPPAVIGVKQNLWGGGGVVAKDYGTGLQLGVTGLHKWHFLDRRTHFLTFGLEGVDTELGRREEELEVRTKDNNLATYDLTVTYRIIPNEGHLIVRDGQQNVYRDRVVATVQSVLREELAELSSEALSHTDARLAVVEQALPHLAEAMSEYHVRPESVLIRAVRFQPAYERKLQEKQLTYQERLLAQSRKAVEDQRAVTETLSAEIERAEKELRGDWDKRLQEVRSENEVAIAAISSEAKKYDQRIRAEADAAFEGLSAEGRLAVDKAEALRNELRNRALDTLGGRLYLARQAAENLRFEHVTLNSNDPSIPSILDVEELVRLLVGADD